MKNTLRLWSRFLVRRSLKRSLKWSLIMTAFVFSAGAVAQDAGPEELGRLKLAELFLEPTVRLSESHPSGTSQGFQIRQASVAAEWSLDSELSGRILGGTSNLLGRPLVPGTSDDAMSLSVIEAFAQWDTSLGRLRAGLLPVGFGYEGLLPEGALDLIRSRPFQQRVVHLRDWGVNYFITHNSFYTSLTVHNGEVGEDVDGRMFQTAAWGWMGGGGLHLGASGSVGRRLNTTTHLEERLRLFNVFGALGGYGVRLLIEGTTGETKSDLVQGQFVDFHIDLSHAITDSFGLQTRYDHFDPNRSVENDLEKTWLVGLYWKNHTQTSTVFLEGSKNWEEGIEIPNDEIRLTWRLDNLARAERNELTGLVRGNE